MWRSTTVGSLFRKQKVKNNKFNVVIFSQMKYTNLNKNIHNLHRNSSRYFIFWNPEISTISMGYYFYVAVHWSLPYVGQYTNIGIIYILWRIMFLTVLCLYFLKLFQYSCLFYKLLSSECFFFFWHCVFVPCSIFTTWHTSQSSMC